MKELLNLECQTRKSFKRHFLSAVHSELRYVSSYTNIMEYREELARVLAPFGFTESKKVMTSNITIKSEPGKRTNLQDEAEAQGFVFTSHSPRCAFQVLHDKFVYSDSDYTGFDNFLDRFKSLTDVVISTLQIADNAEINKVGLRKIDSIIVETEDSLEPAVSLFNPTLFSAGRSEFFSRESFKLLQETMVLERNDKACILKTKLQKRSPKELDAILDFDMVYSSIVNRNSAFSESLPTLNQYHFDLFLWAITDEFKEHLEFEND